MKEQLNQQRQKSDAELHHQRELLNQQKHDAKVREEDHRRWMEGANTVGRAAGSAALPPHGRPPASVIVQEAHP